MSNQHSKDSLIEIGRRGGHVDTSNMHSSQRQQIDLYVNEGRKDAKR